MARIIVLPMAGPSDRAAGSALESAREAVFAGRFYPSDAAEAQRQAAGYLAAGAAVAGSAAGATQRWIGGVVPHAGWICSAAIAGATIAQLKASSGTEPQVVVVFGAIHTPIPPPPAALLDRHGSWAIPGGQVDVAMELRQRLGAEPGRKFVEDERFHRNEHAVEVELPLIVAAFGNAMVLPVEVPVVESAVEIGEATAAAVNAMGLPAIYLASSDLTHYGPSYRFAPAGVGPAGLAWAKENDRRLLDLVSGLAAEQIVPHVRQHHNACGPGAIAAMLAACRSGGASAGRVLQHASSFETLANVAPQPPVDAVGYASVVVG